MFLEFFAAGNIILTDADLKILALLRTVGEGEGQEPQRIGLTYSLENRQNYGGVPALTKERVRDALKTSVEKAAAAAEASSTKKKQKRKPGDELRRALVLAIEELPPIVVDHAFDVTGFEPTAKPAEVLENEALFESLFKALEVARGIVDEVTSSATCKGYIVAKKQETKQAEGDTTAEAPTDKSKGVLYEDFQPFFPRRYENDPAFNILAFDNFNKTVDEFFSSLEGQKLEARLNDREEAAKRKLQAVREIQEQKVEGLRKTQMLNLRKAGAIEANFDRVSEAMDAVNGLVSQGMDWVNIGKLIEREQKRRNPVAEIIKLPLNLEQNTITLLLGEEDEADEDDEPDEGDHTSSEEDSEDDQPEKGKAPDNRLAIEINLGLTPFANAREYYDQKKVLAVKENKTVEQSAMALKSAEKKITQDLKKGLKQEKPVLQLFRRQMWFEKFLWFISSDGYLVVGGRDASQNEMIYKKHLRKGDIYVHADMHGAASVIIKNDPKTPDAPIPPSTLAQAGSLSVCSSNAWDSKAGMGAWWVNADQVSKSAPSGEYLGTGSFMVRGTKNILTPQPLVLGFGFLFKISEESKPNHVKHRIYDLAADIGEGSPVAAPKNLKDKDNPDLEADNQEALGEVEGQDDGANSDVENGDAHGGARQNPLQGHEDEDEVDSDDDHHVDPDTDHVKDDLQKMSIGDSTEVMMSGALTMEGDEEQAPAEEGNPPDKSAEDETQENEASDNNSEAAATEAPTEAPSISTVTTSQQTTKSAPSKRGQRSKQKKIAAKYKHQDDEDRAMHEELIGAAKGRQKAEAEARARAEKQAEEEARRERRKQAQLKQQKKLAEHEEVRRLMLDEGLEVLDENEAELATPLDALVGFPLPGDEILEVVPVCAPWAAMAKCKYKVKLQPGTTKKGKAVKEILERWKSVDASKKGYVDEAARDPERMWPREVELLRGVKPEEANNVVPVSKVTVMVSGGSAAKGGGGGKGKGGGQKGKGGRGGKKK